VPINELNLQFSPFSFFEPASNRELEQGNIVLYNKIGGEELQDSQFVYQNKLVDRLAILLEANKAG